MLKFIEQIAKEAGQICLDATQDSRDFSVELKNGPRDPVTDIDRTVEQFLRQKIKEYYPDHAIIGEEGGSQQGYQWLELGA